METSAEIFFTQAWSEEILLFDLYVHIKFTKLHERIIKMQVLIGLKKHISV